MRLIELHILQSFPVSCLNRDEVGSPKTAIFGGVQRARISSQCLKRAIRLMTHEIQPKLFAGMRTKLLIEPLAERLQRRGRDDRNAALEQARLVGDYLGKLDADAAKRGVEKIKTLMFLSPAELDAIAEGLAQAKPSATADSERDRKKGKGNEGTSSMAKIIQEACAGAALKDAADIAIFGRMVANDHSLTVEGAGLFSHALSTHQADPEIDFYTAVDELQKEDPSVAEEDRAGSGMMGTLEFTTATYYRYIALNLDMLADANHLQALSREERCEVVRTFLRAALLALPEKGRKNSMNAWVLPSYVLGIAKEKGQPIQLVNAFERPVRANGGGFIQPSMEELKKHYAELKKLWNVETAKEIELPPTDIQTFCDQLVEYVI